MCGICGIAGDPSDGSDPRPFVLAMNAGLLHRGPDDGGIAQRNGCTVAMRRLAIIDVAGGAQPMTSPDGRYTIVFNGEIYNYQELRQKLEQDGIHCRTESDTEVILQLFRLSGADTPSQLKGMFAFAIWDDLEKKLFVGRDRFGEKPLFYTLRNGQFGFSSEIRSLLEWPAAARTLNQEALSSYLRFGMTPVPSTLFQGICQLPAGCWLEWKDGPPRVVRYYAPDCRPRTQFRDLTEAAEAVRATILRVVKRQMISEVPLGALLSGGLDSTGIVAAMQMQSSRPVKTFTMRFEHSQYDESVTAREVAEHLGTEHHEAVIANAEFSADDLWRIVAHVGQPFVDSSAIPMYQITRVLRQQVTVCLTGDGGDEMFGGYDYFKSVLRVDQASRFVPRGVARIGAAAAGALESFAPLAKFARPVRRGLEVAAMDPEDRHWAVGEMFSAPDVARLTPSAGLILHPQRNPGAGIEYHGPSRLRDLMFHRINNSLSEDMLVKVDRMSMANSVEIRAPLLDADIADLSMGLPDEYLRRGDIGKVVWREAIRPWLPPSLFSKPKRGFSIPLHRYQNAEYHGLCQDLLLDSPPAPFAEFFDRREVQKYVTQGLLGDRAPGAAVYRTSHQLWSLLHVAAWMRYFRVT